MASTFGGSVLAQDAGLSLSMTDRSIQDCIDHIERTTDYVFIFNKDIDTGQHVSISVYLSAERLSTSCFRNSFTEQASGIASGGSRFP